MPCPLYHWKIVDDIFCLLQMQSIKPDNSNTIAIRCDLEFDIE